MIEQIVNYAAFFLGLILFGGLFLILLWENLADLYRERRERRGRREDGKEGGL